MKRSLSSLLLACWATTWETARVMRIESHTEPHWYLYLLGVDPAVQGQGIGSMLLRSGLERADAARLPAYLETMNPRDVPFYQKFGFSIVHEGEIPGSNIRMWSMLRTPR